MVGDDEGVERDDLAVVVEDVDGKLTGDVGGEGDGVGVDFFLAQHADGLPLSRGLLLWGCRAGL